MALAKGKLVRPRICERCHKQRQETMQMHHDDYRAPLSVRWLCRRCHVAVHVLKRRHLLAEARA